MNRLTRCVLLLSFVPGLLAAGPDLVIPEGCPDPSDPQSDRWSWTATSSEAPQLALDLAGPGTTFDLLADYEGTSILFRVRDAGTGQSVAVVKVESRNTRVAAEVYAYRLACLLGFGELVVPTSPVVVSGGALTKLHALLASVSYEYEWKEKGRLQVLERIEAAQAAGEGFPGAIKPWMKAFMFSGELGEREHLSRHRIMDCLLIHGTLPTDVPVTLRQHTRLYKPYGTHVGVISERDLARDLSNLLLLDALMAQNDRFAGGNLHFRSVAGKRVEGAVCNGARTWSLGAVRLLALDNGGALRSLNGQGLADLKGETVGGTRVERFERSTVGRLEALARRVLGRGCATSPDTDEVRAAWRSLGLDGSDAPIAAGLLSRVLDYLDELREESGDAVFLPQP